MFTESEIVRALIRLDQLEQEKSPLQKALTKTECRLAIDLLRQEMPPAILHRHDRFIRQGRASVAAVEHGVCSACHLRLPSAHSNRLRVHGGPEVCDYCGTFIYVETESEKAFFPSRPATRRTPRSKRARVA